MQPWNVTSVEFCTRQQVKYANSISYLRNTTLKHWLLEDEEKSEDQQNDSISEK